MPETIAAPETVHTSEQTPAQTVAPETTPALPRGTQQDIDRAQLYEKHYGGSPAPVEQVQTPEVPAQVTHPVETLAPPVATLPPEVLQTLQAMQAELLQLREDRKPAPIVETPGTDPSWIDLLREGKIAEAEAAMAAMITKKVKAETQSETIDAAVSRAREVARAEAEVDVFVRELRTANPELAPLEKLIAVEANEKLLILQAAGKIRTTEDTVREYKKAVSESVESARKLHQQLRGVGKQEAQVRSKEVLAASTLPPQQVDTARQQVAGTQEKQPETTEDYFAKRKAAESSRRGLAM